MGYVGPVVIKHLKLRKKFVKGIDINFFSENFYNRKKYSKFLPNIQEYKDIREIQKKDLDGYNKLIILAALSNDPLGKLNPRLTKSINFNATKNIIDIALKLKFKKIIFASSCSIYGFLKNNEDVVSEKYRSYPLTDYAKSKLNIERFVKQKKIKNTKFISLRFGTACGVSPNMRFDIVLNNMFAHATIEKIIKIFSDGKPWRPLIDVDDMAKLITYFNETKCKIKNFEIFNAGSTKSNYTVLDLAKIINKNLPNSKIKIYNKSVNDKRSYKVNFDKLKKFLPKNFKFKSVNTSCKELKRWFKNERIKKISKIYSTRFIRLKKIEKLVKSRKVDKKLNFI